LCGAVSLGRPLVLCYYEPANRQEPIGANLVAAFGEAEVAQAAQAAAETKEEADLLKLEAAAAAAARSQGMGVQCVVVLF